MNKLRLLIGFALTWSFFVNANEAAVSQKKTDSPSLIVNKEVSVAHDKISTSAEPIGITPDAALEKLIKGNSAFANDKSAHLFQNAERRKETALGQHPFAVVVTCSDSRVSPEIIFDQGIADLFVVRTAGNVVTSIELGSIEYATEHLDAPLIIVLGHERCGAVDATIKGGHVSENIASILNLIQPAVDIARNQGGDLLENAVKNNIYLVSNKIKRSPVVADLIEKKRVKVVEGFYDLDDGTVKFRK